MEHMRRRTVCCGGVEAGCRAVHGLLVGADGISDDRCVRDVGRLGKKPEVRVGIGTGPHGIEVAEGDSNVEIALRLNVRCNQEHRSHAASARVPHESRPEIQSHREDPGPQTPLNRTQSVGRRRRSKHVLGTHACLR